MDIVDYNFSCLQLDLKQSSVYSMSDVKQFLTLEHISGVKWLTQKEE